MNRTTLHQFNIITQDRQEGIVTKNGLSLTRLLHNLIREHGRYFRDNYTVNLSDLSLADKRLILSHILDSEEYEEACTNNIRLNTYFHEYRNHIEKLIDDECEEVYREDMEEMRDYR
jgi:hypothetical protein